jgi:hypothetical protein
MTTRPSPSNETVSATPAAASRRLTKSARFCWTSSARSAERVLVPRIAGCWLANERTRATLTKCAHAARPSGPLGTPPLALATARAAAGRSKSGASSSAIVGRACGSLRHCARPRGDVGTARYLGINPLPPPP